MLPRSIAFEGVDGAGKSTVLVLVAEHLRACGHAVFVPREGKDPTSRPARAIRNLARDPALLDLCPAAELALFCAREVQMLHESVLPALASGATVLLDRSLLTPQIIAQHVRGMPSELVLPIVRAAGAQLPIEKTLLFDVHPKTSRLRKRLAKVSQVEDADLGRKGLSGTRFKVRLREGYRQHATEHALPVFTAEQRGPQDVMQAVLEHLLGGRPVDSTGSETPRWQVAPELSFVQALRLQSAKEAVYFSRGLMAGRDLRREYLAAAQGQHRSGSERLREAYELVTWALDPQDPLWSTMLEVAPASALQAMARRPLIDRDDPRWRLAECEPEGSALGLRYVQGDLADALRVRLIGRAPAEVLQSLAWRRDALAHALRNEAWRAADLRSRAESLVGAGFAGTEKWREALYEESPAHAMLSLQGVHDPRGDVWLVRHAQRAPKLALLALTGRDDAAAHDLRRELAEHPRELIDSLRALESECAWSWREQLAHEWPAEVLRSLLGLAKNDRLHSLVARCGLAGAGDVHVLRQLAALQEHGTLPSWAQARGEDE